MGRALWPGLGLDADTAWLTSAPAGGRSLAGRCGQHGPAQPGEMGIEGEWGAGPLSAALPPADGGSLLDSMASGMRLVVSCVSSFLVLSLLLFMVHRLRQRRRERIESLIGANRECPTRPAPAGRGPHWRRESGLPAPPLGVRVVGGGPTSGPCGQLPAACREDPGAAGGGPPGGVAHPRRTWLRVRRPAE